MKRILCVDDEPNVLQGLRRILQPMRHEWEMELAQDSREALNILARRPCDVVVSDIHMPGMDGAELLEEIRRRHPQVTRIVLSGQAEEETVLRTVGLAHQYLSKPCDPKRLKGTLARVFAVRNLLTNPTLRKLVSQMSSLPSLPSLYMKLMQELKSPDSSIARVAEIISHDVGMTAKVLQLVNSAFFGLYQHVSGPEHAVRMLGLRTVAALTLMVHAFSQFAQDKIKALNIQSLTDHCIRVGALGRIIARNECRDANLVGDAVMAGLLHDTGKLVLAANLPEQYMELLHTARETHVPIWETEREVLGNTHAEVGAFLLGLWGLPETVVAGVAFHHDPAHYAHHEFTALTAVHVADVLDHEKTHGGSIGVPPQVDADYLRDLDLSHRLASWREVCDEIGRERRIA